MTAKVFHAELWGKRRAKYDALNAADIENTTWEEIEPQSPFYLFIPQDTEHLEEYEAGWTIRDVLPLNGTGVITKRDFLSIHMTPEKVWDTVSTFAKLSEGDARAHFGLPKDVRDWQYPWAKEDVLSSGPSRDCIKPILYRPFDLRSIYYTGRTRGFIGWPVVKIMRHMLAGENFGLIATRQTRDEWQVLATSNICGHKSCAAYDINTLFPIYLYPDPSHPAGRMDEYWPAGKGGRRPNLNPDFVKEMEGKLGLTFVSDGCGDLKKTFGPEDVFHYMYAVFHSPTYRSRYAEFLKIDFPRLPLTSDVELFVKLCGLGAELVALHLLESPALANPPVRYPVKGDDTVARGYPKYVPVGGTVKRSLAVEPSDAHTTANLPCLPAGQALRSRLTVPPDPSGGRVQINARQYFEPVSEEVWGFHVGGYQVCRKWLKDRRGRKLSYDDITHYRKVVVALEETIRLMAAIDSAVPAWPID